MIQKVIRDGKVAVLVSHCYGAGWVSWENVSPFEPALVEAIEAGITGPQLEDIAKSIYQTAYLGGLENLTVHWIPQGTHFRITEYDGAESLEQRDSIGWLIA